VGVPSPHEALLPRCRTWHELCAGQLVWPALNNSSMGCIQLVLIFVAPRLVRWLHYLLVDCRPCRVAFSLP